MFSMLEVEVSSDLGSDPKVILLVVEEFVRSDKIDLGRFLTSVRAGSETGVDAIETGSTFTSGSSLTGVLMVKSTMLGRDTSPIFGRAVHV